MIAWKDRAREYKVRYGGCTLKDVSWAIKRHAKFNFRSKNPKRGHYSALENGHYRVYTRADEGRILILDLKGDRVVHLDRTYYSDAILRLQKIVMKHYKKS